jgi:hypothetical protein
MQQQAPCPGYQASVRRIDDLLPWIGATERSKSIGQHEWGLTGCNGAYHGEACSSQSPKMLAIGYAPKGMMNGYAGIPIELPTRGLIGYIGSTEGKTSNNLSPTWSPWPKRRPRLSGPA